MPIWHRTIEVADLHQRFRSDEIELHELGKEFAIRIRAMQPHPLIRREEAEYFAAQFEALDEYDDVENLDDILEGFYDWCDASRVWVNTFTKPAQRS